MTNITFEKAIEIALEQHMAGQYKRAEGLYLEILRQDPGNVDALHLLGVLAQQGHQSESAVRLISAAISRKPDQPVFYFNLAEAQRTLNRRDESLASYKKAVELEPNYYEALSNMGNVLNELGRYSEGEVICRRALELDPKSSAALNNLGNSVMGQRRYEEAIQLFEQVLELKPDSLDALNNQALAYVSLGKLEQGAEQFRKAIQLHPARHDLHNNLGTALTRLGRIDQAGASYQTALDIKPDYVEALNNLGASLRALGNPESAIPLFEKAIKLNGDFVRAYANLAAAFNEAGQKQEALEAIDKAVELKPIATDHFLRAMILRDLSRMDEAIDAIYECLRLEPKNIGATVSLAYMHLERGKMDEAMEKLQEAVEINPDPQNHSNMLMTVNYHPGFSPADLFAAHRKWSDLHEKPQMEKWKPHFNSNDPQRKLRVGYVSPDFRGHSVAFFLEPILAHHDHQQFEIYGYAHLANTDQSTWRLRAQIDQWRETATKSADEIAEQIRHDQIDILIELAGHTGGNALTTFARKPAPVQINMIGFPSTTGLTAIDYRITDDLCDPPGVSDPFNSEKLIRMPGVFWCYRPPFHSPDIGPLPASQNKVFTFTSVNNFTKVTPDVQRLWARVLQAVPNSRLIIQTTATGSAQTQKAVTALFAEFNVEPSRLDFRLPTDMQRYLQLLNDSDLTLDPFPFNGGTTTCHSLWMGAPVITLAGDRHASRMGLSMMTAVGLPEFVAHSADEYVDIAVRFAADLPRLAEIRRGMRDRLNSSPLLDAAGYTRNLESAYRTAWRNWCETSSMSIK